MRPSLIIVGLGNPGSSYEKTRHNIGFQAVDLLAETFGEGEWKLVKKYESEIVEGRVVTVPILLVKPHTFMNLSGTAVRKLVDFYKLDPSTQVLILCDDIDLPLGELRLRQKGGPGTHNGLKSLVEQFGEDYPRLRIGLGAPQNGEDLAAWVLSVPPEEERGALAVAVQKIPEIVEEFVIE